MIILLTPSDIKGEAIGKAIADLAEDDFQMSLSGWIYLVAYIQGEQALILRHGNSSGHLLVSVSKLWQILSNIYSLARNENPYQDKTARKEISEGKRVNSPSSRVASIEEGWHRRPRRFNLKMPPELVALKK